MPTLLRVDGFKFFFYANEHTPKHIHIVKNEKFAKISLEDFSIYYSNLKDKDLSFVLEIVKAHKDEFERKWNEFFC